MEVSKLAGTILTGLMVGSELAITVFVHPTLDRLPDDVHLPVAIALARVQGRHMPFWCASVFLLTATEVLITWRQSGHFPMWLFWVL